MNINKFLRIFLIIISLAIISLTAGSIFGYRFDDEPTGLATVERQHSTATTGETAFFAEIEQSYVSYDYDTVTGMYTLFDADGRRLSSLLLTTPYCDSISGFGGSVPMAIVIDSIQRISRLFFMPNSETPSFFERLRNEQFCDSWNGLSIPEAIDFQVDAVSGATRSSNAIIKSIQHRLSLFLQQQPSAHDDFPLAATIVSFVFLVMALLSFISPKKFNRFRLFLLIASVGILGFWLNNCLNLNTLNSWLVNGIDLPTEIFLAVVLLLSVVLPIFTDKPFYCNYVCPFGAAQELIGKINKKKISLSVNLIQILSYLRFVFLFVILVLIVARIDVSISDLEPFSAFRFRYASLSVLILAVLVLFLSILFQKPWCRFFCPTGALLSLFVGKKSEKRTQKITLSLVLNVVFSIGIVVLLYFCFVKHGRQTVIEREPEVIVRNDALEVIRSRKSVRHFVDSMQVTKSQIDTLLRAGMSAPTARDIRPWVFVVINDRSKLDLLSSKLPYAGMLKQASAAIVVCGDLHKAAKAKIPEIWVQDCSAATENILLAAEAIGLGAVWTAAYPYPDRIEPVKKILHLPQNIVPLNVIPIGIPTGEDLPKDKWEPNAIFWNKWEE